MQLKKNLDPILILLILISIFFLFANLGNIYLWEDEAETAVIARNTLAFGYPRAFDGKNTVEVFGSPSWNIFGKFDEHYLWTVHPWLEFYLTAASFALFGTTTFAARLPFAIFGLGSILLTYFLTQKLFRNRSISRITTLLMVFSVPYLLHMRQCRYYALLPFFSLWLVLAYLKFIEDRRFAVLEIIVSSTLLFHSNYGAFISLVAAIGVHYIIFYFNRRDIRKLFAIAIPVGILTIPWLFYFRPLAHVTELSLNNLRRQFEFHFRIINKYVFPIAFFTLVSIYKYIRHKTAPFSEVSDRKKQLWLVVYIILAGIFLLLFVEQRIFRRMIHIVPFLYMLQGIILCNWFKTSKAFTTAVLIILISSNLFNNPKVEFPIFNYIWEITHDYDGPNEGIVKFLNQHAREGDTVKVSYGDRPIIFYCKDLLVDYKGDFETNEAFPEWIIPRRHWVSANFWKSEYYQKILSSYERIEIDYPDLPWGNRPEPGYHKYRTVTDELKVVIFKRLSK